jgi:Flp pilus assembly protein TadG
MRKRHSPRTPRNQRGGVLVLVACTLVVLIGAVGLAVDSGRAYGVKARLNAAVDAAAIAAARALAEGVDDAARIASAEEAAGRFFKLNFPSGFLSSTPSAPLTNAVRESSGRWRVTVSATADMPTTFMRVLGQGNVDVGAVGEAIRRDLDVALVMDTSGSLAKPASAFAALQTAAITGFVEKFSSGEGGDRVGLVSFASGGQVDVQINTDSKRGFNADVVSKKIKQLKVEGSTAQAEGLRKAFEELERVPIALRSSLRVILLFSDGAPNMVNGTFERTNSAGNPLGSITGNLYSETSKSSARPKRVWPEGERNGKVKDHSIATLPKTGAGGFALDDRHLPPGINRELEGDPYENSRCNVNKAARNLVENIAYAARDEEIYIYTIGLGDALNTLEISFCKYENKKESGAAILRRIANAPDADGKRPYPDQPQGMYCHAATESELQRCFSTIASEVLRLTL